MRKPGKNLGITVFLTAVVIFLFTAPFFILPMLYKERDVWGDKTPENAVFLELWQIDTFEGGSAARGRFLERNAIKFQQQNNDVYVFVRTLSLEQAINILGSGSLPDMVSFGIGAGELLKPYCKQIPDVTGVRNDIAAGGKADGEILAIPWCMGGYVLCAKSEYEGKIDLKSLVDATPSADTQAVLGYGESANVPLKTLTVRDGVKFDGSMIYQRENEKITQYQAYEAFLSGGDFDVLLGTQRDFFRLKNKADLGAMDKCTFEYLSGYTDLVQYMGVTASDEKVKEKACEFISFICSTKVQSHLSDIGMFTVNGTKIYTDEYADFERALSGKTEVLNVFTTNARIEEIRTETKSRLFK